MPATRILRASALLAIASCGGGSPVRAPLADRANRPEDAPLADAAGVDAPYERLFTRDASWELRCRVRAFDMPSRDNGRPLREETLRCRVADAQALGAGRVAHVVCDDASWTDAQLTGWYFADARGLWKLDNETGPMDIPIVPRGDPDAPRRLDAADLPALREDDMLLAATPAPRTVDDRSGEGMRIVIDSPIDAAWCVRQVSSYGGAPRWRTFCYQAGVGLVGASQANGEAGLEERCGMAPLAQFELPRR